MKPFFLFLAMSLTSLFASAQSFDSLWKTEQQQEADGKPQTAYATVQRILQKAVKEGHEGQALSARLRAAALHQEWSPDSFFTDVAELEALRRQDERPVAKAIYASTLAEIYHNNRSRSQASGLELTSGEMKEWTREQYDSASARNWQLSLEDIPSLGNARSRDWLPFIVQNEQSAYFKHDLLHILWQRMAGLQHDFQLAQVIDFESYRQAVCNYYHEQGNREAELLVRLESATAELLPALKEEFADLPLCVEVYSRLMSTEAPDSLKVAWAEEALKRYPRYERIGIIRNQLNELRRPLVNWTGNAVYYPGKEYTWKLTSRNATTATLTVYRLKNSFNENDVASSKLSINQYFAHNAALVETLKPRFAKGAVWENVEDSLRWTAPAPGRYAILYSASTDEREATKKTVTNQYSLFSVSALMTLQRSMPDGTLEVIVVDAESGQPVPDALVSLLKEDSRTRSTQVLNTQRSTADGRTRFSGIDKQRGRFLVKVEKEQDRWLPTVTAFNSTPRSNEEQKGKTLRLYTDRAIYRPGQTVHVGGIAYSQQHWDAQALGGESYELILRDANWKEVARETVKTDEMGVLSVDFALPEGRLPGMYRIQAGSASVYFRVEEYKRPTFEVKMDEAPALTWPQDSITLTGKALGYNGVPVREGRVTGNYQFTYPYFWWYRHEDSPRMPIDTVYTDEAGAFRVRVPLNEIPAEALKYGLCLALDVEVLSAAGETREGSSRVSLCTTPLRLTVRMNEKQDRDRLKAPTFSLLSSTGQSIDGEIHCSIYPITEPASTVAAVPDVSPSDLLAVLRDLPSGHYELHATATAAGATAADSTRFYIFSLDDSSLPLHAESWLYCPTDTFDAQHPALLQVGSSFPGVALYYCLTSSKGIIRDELIPLSNELRLLEIPYEEAYGDGLTASFAFVKHGQPYHLTQSLRLTRPDTQLRWQWTSFRDRLHPGDKEQWTLRLTRPDGTPASANLMAVIYDASLEQLAPHAAWDLTVSRWHRLLFCNWTAQQLFMQGNAFQHLYFPMKNYRAKSLAFDTFDDTWMNGLNFFMNRRMVVGSARPMMMKASRASTEESAVFDGGAVQVTAAPQMAAMEANDAAEEEVAATGYGATEEDAEAETVSAASAAVRTNFNETAAFMPRLLSNPETGEVTLSFTLPESLTTWQLLGIAHTQGLMTTGIQAQAVTHKELMAQLHLPRFLRAGDRSSLRASIQNLTEETLSGKAKLEIFDPETSKVLHKASASFTAEANGEAILAFDYAPATPAIVAVRLTAETASFTDGEQHYLPILTDHEWMTESVEIQADSLGTFNTDLSTLFNANARTATQRRLTVEYTTHPIWTVVQALPALREPQTDDVLSITSVFYADALAAHIAATTPRLHDILQLWKKEAATPTAATPAGSSPLTSPLATDSDLKQLILEETPWLRAADSDTQRRAQLLDLFNENLVGTRLTTALDRLSQRQQADGGFSWFPGMRSSELMTRLVCIELTRLRSLTADFASLPATTKQRANALLQKAFTFIAEENAKLIQELKKAEAKGNTIQTGTLMHLHYVYVTQRAGIKLTKAQQADVRYLLDHLKGTVTTMSNDERAMAAIVLRADGRKQQSQLYFDSMREHLTTTPQRGTFFDYAGGSFTPTSHKVVVHTAAMEAVRDFATDGTLPATLLPGLRRWLLQQKRTQMWESSICTADAIYALLHDNATELEDVTQDKLTLAFGKKKVSLTTAPTALGYLRQSFTDGAAPSSITVERRSTSEGWGAVYAQYLTPTADATAAATGLSIRRDLSTTTARLGDKFTTRYVITADRDYEYVCLRTDRAACTEPAELMSGYRYQGGLGYYRAVHDAHTDYFFDRLPKGTYVLEETAFIDRTGHYTTGLCRLQCLYAPEFNAHTAAQQLTVK